ncbi:hypothetical protein [Paenibacillus aquistagni]|uniref:hypothetical protein n=1 Tax=Paenibacillus aquistagni TaxID=1852522 RepID=UPI000B506345|nr:hypothetical protein [Paenibacillus aquistagni]
MILVNWRRISIATLLLPLMFVWFDEYLIHEGVLEGIGLASAMIIPPIGMLFAMLSFRSTESTRDLALVAAHFMLGLFYFIYMSVGTLIFGI